MILLGRKASLILVVCVGIFGSGCEGVPVTVGSGGTIAVGGAAPAGGSHGFGGSGGSDTGAGAESTGSSTSSPPTGGANSTGGSGGSSSPEDSRVLVPNWSVHKRLRSEQGNDFVLEEVLQGFAVAMAPQSRIRALDANMNTAGIWLPPATTYVSDFTRHASGEFSVVLIAENRSVSIARLAPNLTLLGLMQIHDPDIVNDPHALEFGATDLAGSGLTLDPVRVGATGETAVVAVVSSMYSAIAYRLVFDAGAWSAPARTLIEPPSALVPFLPIGGSFDTFGAIGVWARCSLDVDDAGDVYVVVWAGQHRIRDHVSAFSDGLSPLPSDPSAPPGDSDLLLTKMGADGTRRWSRVIGTPHEDEPYAIRAGAGFVAVVGRSRRFPGEDNTVWDALLSVVTSSGDWVGTRTMPFTASSIVLAVDALPSGGWLLGGSDGWSQNPEGLSIGGNGIKLLFTLNAVDATPSRYDLTPGPRHNEIRSVVADPTHLWYGGHEDGPVMHTGDTDPSQIHATGVLGTVSN